MDCKTCKDHKRDVQPVPYIVHEAAMARQERHAKRLIIAFVVAILLGFASNMAWLWFFNQYEYVAGDSTVTTSTTYTQDGKGLNIIGSDNEVSSGSDADGNDYHKETSGSNAEKERTKQGDAETQKETP